MVPYEDLKLVNRAFEDRFREQFEKVVSRGWYILGEEVSQFENEFAALHDAGHCVGVANGLDALTLSLKALQLPPGSEILVPSNTYIATILSILHSGHKPVLVESDINTYNIDPDKLTEAITNKTRGALVVHLYGKCCDMNAILEVCVHHKLALVEDCAQSHGARYKGRLCGTFGASGAFSFYPTKNLGCLGDGGAVLTNDENMASTVRLLRNYGSATKYYNEQVGYNSRLDELQAAFLRVKLPALERINAHKKQLATIYLEHLREDFIKPVVHNDYDDVYHIFAIRHPRRDELKKYLAQKGIGTEIHYPVPPHRQQALRSLFAGSYPISEQIHDTILSLPCSTAHTPDDIYRVVEAMNTFRG